MATGSRKFQAPKGTRDFYPQDMAVRRYIEGVWRQTSINHGFDEIEGPMFEDLELYMHKSGPGIVSELFQVYSGKDKAEIEQIQKTGQAPFALRPEFTPTLARMVAAKAAELPRPIKWFAIPQHFRAERPQRGRLREFLQWNVDFMGESSLEADIEIMSCSIASLEKVGMRPSDVRIVLNDRSWLAELLSSFQIPTDQHPTAFELLDQSGRVTPEAIVQLAAMKGITSKGFSSMLGGRTLRVEVESDWEIQLGESMYWNDFRRFEPLRSRLRDRGIADWCSIDISLARGLAYYTGIVFEIHETTGAERAIAGGGRYDNLIEGFGGPKLPACGFGMGDVVLGNLLHDKGLLPEEVYMKPLRPHAFAIAANDEAEPKMRQTVAALRRDGFHVRHSYKSTRNVGKLLGDASKSRAMTAIIFGSDAAPPANRVDLKDLDGQSQETIAISEIASKLKDVIRRNDESK